jgi:hypothetical protein
VTSRLWPTSLAVQHAIRSKLRSRYPLRVAPVLDCLGRGASTSRRPASLPSSSSTRRPQRDSRRTPCVCPRLRSPRRLVWYAAQRRQGFGRGHTPGVPCGAGRRFRSIHQEQRFPAGPSGNRAVRPPHPRGAQERTRTERARARAPSGPGAASNEGLNLSRGGVWLRSAGRSRRLAPRR